MSKNDKRAFIAVVTVGSIFTIRKFRPQPNGSWDVWRWEGGWTYHDNVGQQTASDWQESADEVYYEIETTN
jgi:hypothetical protein